MEEKSEVLDIKCPKCNSRKIEISELWQGNYNWSIGEDGTIISSGQSHSSMSGTGKYEAKCSCGHIWKIRKKIDLKYEI